ncbi:signal peptidase I [Cellulomonas cellasea]|uniref:Signal peptidase I n=1 Tax=Cellulomonas cellasea TaxID=43670 RepID=A0A7W4YCK9_9CELL|nr:signal peptidase I [Cellulomonas cellasea]MBB2924893.1 signal peptidase I [Cellulomonas cellasea]
MTRATTTSRSRALTPPGWGRLVVATVARSYLVLLAALAAVAFVPGMLGWHTSVVQTGSMMPTINPGDVVLTTTLPDDQPVPVGAVVQYDSPAEAEPSGVARIRLHRVVGANDDGTFVTAGDANAEPDSTPITRDQIIGQGRLLAPYIGLPSLWVTHRDVPALATWLAVTALAVGLASRRAATGSDDDETRADPPPARRAQAGPPARRTALTVVVLGVAVGSAVAPPEPATAAFSARTSMTSTWAAAIPAPLTVGRAAPYALIGSSAVTNTGPSPQVRITGSIAVTPGTEVTGFPWGTGTDVANSAARNAQADATTLYAAATRRPTTATPAAVLTGTLRPGTHRRTGALALSGTLTLDALGDPSAVFVLAADSITARAGSTVRLTGGASAANVYWVTPGSVNLLTASTSVGTYVAQGNVTIERDTTLAGRAISLGGYVTLTRTDVAVPR